MGDSEKKEIHLDVYLDRQELHMSNVVKTYYEGMQSAAAKQRYEKIKKTLKKQDGRKMEIFKSTFLCIRK